MHGKEKKEKTFAHLKNSVTFFKTLQPLFVSSVFLHFVFVFNIYISLSNVIFFQTAFVLKTTFLTKHALNPQAKDSLPELRTQIQNLTHKTSDHKHTTHFKKRTKVTDSTTEFKNQCFSKLEIHIKAYNKSRKST